MENSKKMRRTQYAVLRTISKHCQDLLYPIYCPSQFGFRSALRSLSGLQGEKKIAHNGNHEKQDKKWGPREKHGGK